MKRFHLVTLSHRIKWVLIGIMLASLAGCNASNRPVAHRQMARMKKPPVKIHKTQSLNVESQPLESSCSIGRSVQGREIHVYLFVHSDSYDDAMNLKPGVEKVLILGGTHGNETTGATTAHRLVIELKKNPELYRNRYVAIVPEINPDGLAVHSRVNANGVDLNRNLPAANWCLTKPGNSFGGPSPCSEPETQALIKLIEQFKPDRILTLHSIAEGRHGNNYDGPAKELAERISRYNGYRPLATMGYPTPGSLGTWAGIERHIPIITLEVPRCRTAEQCWQENDRALIAFIWNKDESPHLATSDPRPEHQEANPPAKLGN